MADIYKRNDIVNFQFTFIDAAIDQPIDVLNPFYTITYFNGTVEVIVVSSTALTHLGVGTYGMQWLIPSTAIVNLKYYVHASGEHPVSHIVSVFDETFQIFSEDYFGGGLVVKFTKE